MTKQPISRSNPSAERGSGLEAGDKTIGRDCNEYTFDGLIKKLEKISDAHGRRKRREEYERRKAVRAIK